MILWLLRGIPSERVWKKKLIDFNTALLSWRLRAVSSIPAAYLEIYWLNKMLKQRLYTSVLYINRNLHMAEHNIFLEEFCGEYLSLLEWKMSENPQPRFQVSPNEAMKTSPPKNLLWLSTRSHSFSLMNLAPNVLQNDCLSKNRKKK